MIVGTRPLYDGFCLEYQKETKGRSITHSHFGIEFHFCEMGDGLIRSGRIVKRLLPGYVTLLYGPASHGVESNPDKHYFRTVMYVPEVVLHKIESQVNQRGQSVLPCPTRPIIQLVPDRGDYWYLKKLLLQLHVGMTQARDSVPRGVINHLAHILAILSRNLDNDGNPSCNGDSYYRDLLDDALFIIENSGSTVPFVDELAEKLGVSTGHLRRVFRQVLGESPGEYLLQQRMEWAKHNLRLGMSVSQVAARAGYADATTFGRAFRKYTGVAPRVFVKRNNRQ